MKTVKRSYLDVLCGKGNLIKKPATCIKTQNNQWQTFQAFLLHITDPRISLDSDLFCDIHSFYCKAITIYIMLTLV